MIEYEWQYVEDEEDYLAEDSDWFFNIDPDSIEELYDNSSDTTTNQ